MARGAAGAGFGAYRGRSGQTGTRVVHVSLGNGALAAATVYATVNVEQDPELAARMLGSGDPLGATLEDGSTLPLQTPTVYHDPSAEVFVLVLGEGDRHRELACRIELLQRLVEDAATIPPYVKDFSVAFGSMGLRALLAAATRSAAQALAEGGPRVDEPRRAPRPTQARIRSASLPPMGPATSRTVSIVGASAITGGGPTARVIGEPTTPVPPQAELLAALDTAFPGRPRSDAELVPPVERGRRASAMRRITVPPPMAGAESAPLVIESLADPAPAPTDWGSVSSDDIVPPIEAGPREDGQARGDQADVAVAEGSAHQLAVPDLSDELIDSAPVQAHAAADVAAQTRAEITPPAEPAQDERAAADVPDVPELIDGADLVDAGDTGELALRASTDVGIVPLDDGPPVVAARVGTLEAVADADMPEVADPVVTEFLDVGAGDSADDPWLAEWERSQAPSAIALLGTEVRLAARVGRGVADRLRFGAVDLLLTMHRTSAGPIVAVALGTPASLRSADRRAITLVTLDVANDVERAALAALGRDFALTIDLVLFDGARRRGRLVGRLAENAGFVLRAADDHRRATVAAGGECAPARARATVADPAFDLFGVSHPEHARFEEKSFARLSTASLVQRALVEAAHYTQPVNEDYLVCTRGYALSRWREVRRGVLARAVEWGLWLGGELAQVAISEGFARSRRDLVARLGAGFDLLRTFPQFCDLAADAVDANLRALAAEAEAVGAGTGRVRVDSESDLPLAASQPRDGRQAAGTIDVAVAGSHTSDVSVDALIAQLESRSERLDAAIALCERADPRALEPVMAAVSRMSRAEAVRVLGMMVRFGTAAGGVLTQGLSSSKGFLRHGCALALAMLRTEAGTEAVIELLLREPTEIWREIARAVGQVGPAALMPLASHLGRLGDRATAATRERVAWAMAHVAVRGGRSAVEALAAGQSVVAPVAAQAVGFIAPAARDEVRVRPGGAPGTQPGREVTVNRAFSRRFFEAMEKGLPAMGMAELTAMDASEPMELLDEADLEEDDDAEAIDERDVIS